MFTNHKTVTDDVSSLAALYFRSNSFDSKYLDANT